jgi:hypothetical protein
MKICERTCIAIHVEPAIVVPPCGFRQPSKPEHGSQRRTRRGGLSQQRAGNGRARKSAVPREVRRDGLRILPHNEKVVSD